MPGFPVCLTDHRTPSLTGAAGPPASVAPHPGLDPEGPENGALAPALSREPAIPLGLLAPGEKAVVVDIRGGRRPHGPGCCGHGSLSRLEDLGLRLGKTLEVLNNRGACPLLIKVDESRLALGRGVAMKILVRRVQS